MITTLAQLNEANRRRGPALDVALDAAPNSVDEFIRASRDLTPEWGTGSKKDFATPIGTVTVICSRAVAHNRSGTMSNSARWLFKLDGKSIGAGPLNALLRGENKK